MTKGYKRDQLFKPAPCGTEAEMQPYESMKVRVVTNQAGGAIGFDATLDLALACSEA